MKLKKSMLFEKNQKGKKERLAAQGLTQKIRFS